LAGAIPDEEILDAVEESYRLVVTGLPKKRRPAGWEDVGPPEEKVNP
jgi:predicted DNA-binding protein (MmcQ/YjbR family)